MVERWHEHGVPYKGTWTPWKNLECKTKGRKYGKKKQT